MDDTTTERAYDEAALVTGLRGRDEDVFAWLVDAWGATMRRVARTFVSTEATAEEVVQDTWLAVLQGVDRFEGRSSLRTWVFRILSNTARTRGVREHRSVPMSSLGPADDSGPTVDPDRFRGADDRYPGGWKTFPGHWPEAGRSADHRALGRDVRTVVSAALADLPARQRVVVTLRDVHEFDADEVCELLDLSPGNQRVLLHRGRATVRAKLEEHYGATARWGGDAVSDLSCAEFVELVTDYLEGALEPHDVQRFEEHADRCPGCDVYLDQIRRTIGEVGQLTPDHLEPQARDRLLEAFRTWTDHSAT